MKVLSGLLEVVAHREARHFTTGDVLLVEDTSGSGHASTVLEDLTMAVVRP